MNKTQQANAAKEREKAKPKKPSAKVAEVDKSVKGFIDVPAAIVQELKGVLPAEKVSPPGKGNAYRVCCGTRRGKDKPHSAACHRYMPDGTVKA